MGQSVCPATDQVEGVDEHDVVRRRDFGAATEPRRDQRLEVLVPRREIENLTDRGREHVELGSTFLLADCVVTVKASALQQRENGLEPPALESDEHGDTQELVGGGFDKVVVRARAAPLARDDAGQVRKLLEPASILLAVDREHRKDEVSLRELRAAAVDSEEDLSATSSSPTSLLMRTASNG